MTEERIYIIPLRKEWGKVPKHERAKKASRAVRAFLSRHMKTPLENIRIGLHLNEALWVRGMKHPPHKIKIKTFKEDDIVHSELFGKEYTTKQEKKEEKKGKGAKKEEAREEQKEEETKEVKEEKKEEKTEEKKPAEPKKPNQKTAPKAKV